MSDGKILTKEHREDNDDNKNGVFWSNKGGMLETSDDKCVVNRVVTGILATPRWLKPKPSEYKFYVLYIDEHEVEKVKGLRQDHNLRVLLPRSQK